MNYRKLLVLLLFTTTVFSQTKDTIAVREFKNDTLKFRYKALIIPGVLIGYGVVGLGSDMLQSYNTEAREEIKEGIDEKFTIDDFSQYTPAATVYILNAAGIKGKHNLKDRSVILATSLLIMGTTTTALKHLIKIERPDGTSNNSFPSGHTANAFAGAEFLFQEYKDVSVWYGVSGYVVATGTGLFRMYNNRHWLTDVATGAGIGILSTKVAYWIHPFVERTLGISKSSKTTSMLMPFYDGKKVGFGYAMSF